MALHGTFPLNRADLAPLMFYGVGTFPAYSGDGKYRNQPGCTHAINNGALPHGRYWIVPRPTGGIRTKFLNLLADAWTGRERDRWLALYRDDGVIDDSTWIDNVQRGGFRLHPPGASRSALSKGCLTLLRNSDYEVIHTALMRTNPITVPGTELLACGIIEVDGYAIDCPATP